METSPEEWQTLATHNRNRPPIECPVPFAPLDVRDRDAVVRLVGTFRPEVVIHTASIGSVDEAEQNPSCVRGVNVEGTRHVTQACRLSKGFLVFISSNAVFDGQNPPYGEEAPVRAINRYGQLKIEAEDGIKESGLPYLIARPILMYGWPWPGGRDNVVTRWLMGLEKRQGIEVADDIVSMPLLSTHCAQTIWEAIRQRMTGFLHVAGADRVSLVDFARQTARAFGCDESLVVPAPSRRFTSLAPRPRDTTFLTTRMQRELGIRPMGLVEGLARMLRSRVPNVGVASREPIHTA